MRDITFLSETVHMFILGRCGSSISICKLSKLRKTEPNCLATRYAVGVHASGMQRGPRIPMSSQLSWAGSEIASILRGGDSTSIEPPIAWAGLAMVHRARHGFEIEHNELVEVKGMLSTV